MVFDIETIPDIEGGSRLYDLNGLSDEDKGKAMFRLQEMKTGNEFIPHHLQRIVAISVVFRYQKQVHVWSLGEETSNEKEILQRFFDGVERFTPTLVSWNGCGFDLPVMHYRSLLRGVSAPSYWEVGDNDNTFRNHNYLNRFQWRHTDLMDVLAGYQLDAAAPLNDIAALLGFPGKMSMNSTQVWKTWLAGDIQKIRNYCEIDVLNTYLVYLRFELIRGKLSTHQYHEEEKLLRTSLITSEKSHLIEFNQAWK